MHRFLQQFILFAETTAIEQAQLKEAQLKEAEWQLNIIVVIFFLPIAIFAVLSILIVRPWRKAVRLGLDLSVSDFIGLKLRRVPSDLIIDVFAFAADNEIELSCFDVKYAFLDGVDIEKAVNLLVKLHREDETITFLQAVERLNSGVGIEPEHNLSENRANSSSSEK